MAILGQGTSRQTREYSKTTDARKIICGTQDNNQPEPVVKSVKQFRKNNHFIL